MRYASLTLESPISNPCTLSLVIFSLKRAGDTTPLPSEPSLNEPLPIVGSEPEAELTLILPFSSK